MLEDHEFCDTCPGCRPAILTVDKKTNTAKPIPDTDPIMVAINKFWDTETTYAQRKAYIEVTVKNSRRPNDMRLTEQVTRGIQNVLSKT